MRDLMPETKILFTCGDENPKSELNKISDTDV